MKQRLKWYGIIAAVVVLVDQATKWLILHSNPPYDIMRYLTLELTFNRGISWGLLSRSSHVMFLTVSSVIAILTLVLGIYAYGRYRKGLPIVPEVLIIAGSCSNLIDRVIHGGVVDFILVHYEAYLWPIFNVADICVVFGVMGLFFRQLTEKELHPKA